MNKREIKRPIILILILCILGILFAYFDVTSPLIFIPVIIALVIYACKKDNYDRFFIFLAGIVFIISFLTAQGKLNYFPEINSFNDKKIEITGQVISPAVNKSGRTQVYIKNVTYTVNNKAYFSNDKILVNVYDGFKNQTKNNNIHFKTGDYYSFTGKVKIPAAKRNYGGFDYNLYLKTINVNTSITTYKDNVKFVKDSSLPFQLDKLYEVKEFFKEKLRSGLKDTNKSDLIMGILFSDKELDESIREDFSTIGLSHIMAVSGLHIGMVYIMLEFFMNALSINKKKRIFIITPILIFYIILAGMSPSAVRAGILCVINMIVSLDEKYDGDLLNYILITMLIMLIINPLNLFNISFQLSFLAVFGIVFFARVITAKLPEAVIKNSVLRFIIEVMIMSFSTTVLTLPVLVNSFSGVPIISIIANMIITPFIALIMMLSVLAALLSFTPLSSILFAVLSASLGYILSAARFLSSLSYSFMSVPYMHIHDIILYLTIIFALSPYITLKNKRHAVISILIIAICTGINIYNIMPRDYAEVHFLDIGQGNCSVIITPERKCIMLDGGGSVYSDYNTGENTIKPFLSYYGISEIDTVFISHTDADHVKGIYELKGIIPIKNAVVGYLDDEQKNEINANIQANITKTNKGDVYNIGSVKISTINETNETNSRDNNDKSVVFMIECNGAKILYPADMTENIAEELLNKKNSTDLGGVDIMDSAHHGSYYPAMDKFMEKTNPRYCTIQAGSNNYKLPNEKFLELLRKNNTTYYITKTDGGIRFKIYEKHNIKVNTLLEE